MAEILDLKSFKVKFGKRVKFLREQKKLTQPALAILLDDMDYQSLGRIENGRVNTSSYLSYRIAKALDVTIEELYDFSETV